MLAAEIRRIAGRRGSFWSALLVGLGAVVILIVVRLTQSGDVGGTELLDAMDPISTVATLMAVLVGALAGSYDTAQGTMRYLVMTGVPRRRLYLTRVLGTAIATIICCTPAIVLAIVAAYVTRHDAFNDPDSELGRRRRSGRTSRTRSSTASSASAWARCCNSNGAAIGVSLGFALGGAHPDRRDRQLPQRDARRLPAAGGHRHRSPARRHDQHIPVAAAFAAVVAWLVAFLGAGLWRVLRDEY